jgi:hypothetical protein
MTVCVSPEATIKPDQNSVSAASLATLMGQRSLQVAVLTFLLTTQVLPCFCQTSAELKTFLSQRLGLSQDQITAIRQGQPFAKNAEPRSPAEIFVIGVIYINAAPESYVKFVSDPNNLRHLPFPEFLALKNFSTPPQLSDLQGFGLDSDDIKALKDCKPGKCEIQLPASNAMDELRKSVIWSALNVDEQVNQQLQKLALSRLQDYQKDGNRIFGPVYNDKGQQVNVADQFKYMLSYYQVLPKDLPDFNKYILDYPNAKMPNVQNTFLWERVNFGLKPTLFIIQVLTIRGDKPGEAAYVIADKQLYPSHYFETSLDLTFLIRGDDPKRPGFYLVKTMACEQALLTGGLKASMERKIAVSRSVSNLQKSLAYVKNVLEHQK